MTKKEIKNVALKYLKGNRLMVLATSVRDQPWVATVFFAFDNKFNLYFFSRENTKHCKNIKKNPKVAVAVSQDWGTPGFIKGFQMSGKAVKVSKREYARPYALFRKRFPWADKHTDHVLYRITPIEVHHINKKAFGHHFRVRVL